MRRRLANARFLHGLWPGNALLPVDERLCPPYRFVLRFAAPADAVRERSTDTVSSDHVRNARLHANSRSRDREDRPYRSNPTNQSSMLLLGNEVGPYDCADFCAACRAERAEDSHASAGATPATLGFAAKCREK